MAPNLLLFTVQFGKERTMIPGEILPASGEIVLNKDAAAKPLKVANTGDRPIQVGSHYHFAEANAALAFDREPALGCRLDIPPGTPVRFYPGHPPQLSFTPYQHRPPT